MGKLQEARNERDLMVQAFCDIYQYMAGEYGETYDPSSYVTESETIRVVKKFVHVDEEGICLPKPKKEYAAQ